MKKFCIIAALIGALITISSAYQDSPVGTAEGKFAPQIALGNDSSEVTLSSMRGKYVLLSFWSSTDGASRALCNMYDAYANTHHGDNLQLVGVNLDDSEVLYREVVRLDGLDRTRQYHLTGKVAEHATGTFDLGNGLGTYLIDPAGRIVARNPSTESLALL